MADPRLVELVLQQAAPDDETGAARVLADAALEEGDLALAASALDRAFGLTPTDEGLRTLRAQVLDALEVREHGLVFRYVPAGSFLMGSTTGDVDEQPVHAVRTEAYWLTDTPVTLEAFERLAGPQTDGGFDLRLQEELRFLYSATEVDGAPGLRTYEVKPMVAVSWQLADRLASALTTKAVEVRLPTEAEWEKAARGGLIGKRYAWGDAPPDDARCDSGHFGTFAIKPPRSLPPNGYGLYGMCGGVWEWTCDRYDALAYHPRRPPVPAEARAARTLRGGSFTDTAAAVTVSFRAALRSEPPGSDQRSDHLVPNIGFRLLRRAVTLGR